MVVVTAGGLWEYPQRGEGPDKRNAVEPDLGSVRHVYLCVFTCVELAPLPPVVHQTPLMNP